MLATSQLQDVLTLMQDARARTNAYTADLSDEQFQVPLLDIINPPLWELGHIAYFGEFWTLRNLYGRPPIIARADQLYDSAKIAHDDRWSLPLPPRSQTLAFMKQELDDIVEAAPRAVENSKDALYFHKLALYHEDMHGEAFVYARQTLAYPMWDRRSYAMEATQASPTDGAPLPGDVSVPGGTYRIGSRPDDGFVFDNEKWDHGVTLDGFDIAQAPVTNAEFARFVSDGGYERSDLWSGGGWRWRQHANAEHPLYWRRAPASRPLVWERRHFNSWTELRPHEPVCHVNWHEAQAYCAWAGRRLPSEAEWEVAATGGTHRRYPWGDEPTPIGRANVDAQIGDVVDVGCYAESDSPFGCRQMIGNVWEWTATSFGPYPGFVPDPYKEYSQPWFGTHKALRGGAWSTRARLITARWRNFYRPERRDIITGFRTCKP
jgi:iron(II)-dependent oxidoreductase